MISIESTGNFEKTSAWLNKMSEKDIFESLGKYGAKGVQALSSATPVDSNQTASSWDFEVAKSKDSYTITWTNSNIVDGVPIAILIQYGHGTGTGGYVVGRDYINPALQGIFDEMAESVWKVVTE